MPSSFCDSSTWRIVFRDEFDLPTIDKRWWTILNGTHKKPHDQLKADCHGSDCDLLGACRDAACTVDSVKVAGGRLVLTSQRRRAFGRNFTTGAVITRDKLTFLSDDEPFRMCIAAVLPGVPGGSAGVWPAHWLMPNDGSCDPDHGEMDIMEMVKGDGTAYSTYHWQDKGAPKCAFPHNHSHAYSEKKLADGWNTTLHEFAVERGASHVAFALDGNVVLNTSKAVFTRSIPWYLILNTAIGGGWPGPVTPETTFPITHEIDFVRVARPVYR